MSLHRQTTALLITAAVALGLLLVLTVCTLSGYIPARSHPGQPAAEMATELPEFVDMLPASLDGYDDARPYSPVEENHRSEAALPGGTDIVDAGSTHRAVKPAGSTRPSPVTTPQSTPIKQDEAAEERLREDTRRRVREGISDAFKSPSDQADNTAAAGNEQGNTGSPDGSASNVAGVGSGSVGGGWIMPSYAKVKSALTGSIELRATVGADGSVTAVEQVGGKAPAGADAVLVARCITEVRSRRFTRRDDIPPASATARITYIFR